MKFFKRGKGVRRPETRRSAEEGEMTDDQFEFLQAIEKYKKHYHKRFLSYTELLDIVVSLGYKKGK